MLGRCEASRPCRECAACSPPRARALAPEDRGARRLLRAARAPLRRAPDAALLRLAAAPALATTTGERRARARLEPPVRGERRDGRRGRRAGIHGPLRRRGQERCRPARLALDRRLHDGTAARATCAPTSRRSALARRGDVTMLEDHLSRPVRGDAAADRRRTTSARRRRSRAARRFSSAHIAPVGRSPAALQYGRPLLPITIAR